MRRNLELKARLHDLERARRVAREVAAEHLPPERQVDTYFRGAQGRLKLREIEGRGAQLIWYRRDDTPEPKPSDYLLVPVSDSAALREALAGAYGIDVVVAKSREIYLHHQVRIHLDLVDGLGTFLEFEAVLSEVCDAKRGKELLDFLTEAFAIEPASRHAVSYSDLLRERRGKM